MRVLVCGGAGYIGSNMVSLLGREGPEAIGYDNFSKGHREAVKGSQIINGDLSDCDLITTVLQTRKIDAVMHFAAFIEVGESVNEPLRYYNNNVCNTWQVLCAMDRAGVDKFVFSSTAAV